MPSKIAANILIWTLTFSENALYGGFFVLYVVSTLLLAQRGKHIRKNKAAFHGDTERLRTMRFWEITGLIMFFVLTIHWLLNWVIYLAELSEATARKVVFVRMLMSEIALVVGDLTLIHRLWVVSNKNKLLIAFPLFFLTAFFAFAIPLSWEYFLVYWRKPLPSILSQRFWLMGLVISTLSVNLYCTCAMSWKIWQTTKSARQYGGGQLMHVIAILVESAAIYSLWMVTVLGFLIAQHSFYIIFYDIATELYGVSTMLISVRAGLGWTIGSSSWTMQSERVSHGTRPRQDETPAIKDTAV